MHSGSLSRPNLIATSWSSSLNITWSTCHPGADEEGQRNTYCFFPFSLLQVLRKGIRRPRFVLAEKIEMGQLSLDLEAVSEWMLGGFGE